MTRVEGKKKSKTASYVSRDGPGSKLNSISFILSGLRPRHRAVLSFQSFISAILRKIRSYPLLSIWLLITEYTPAYYYCHFEDTTHPHSRSPAIQSNARHALASLHHICTPRQVC